MGAITSQCTRVKSESAEECNLGVSEQHGSHTWMVYPGPVYILKGGCIASNISALKAEVETMRNHHSRHICGPFEVYDDKENSGKMLCTYNYYVIPHPTDPEPKVALAVANSFLTDFGKVGTSCLSVHYPRETATHRQLPFHVDLEGEGGPVLTMSWGASADFFWKPDSSSTNSGLFDYDRILTFRVDEGDVLFFDGGRIPHAVQIAVADDERYNIQVRETGASIREGCASSEVSFLTEFRRHAYGTQIVRYPYGSPYDSWYVIEEKSSGQLQALRAPKMYIDLLIGVIRNEKERETQHAPHHHAHDLALAGPHLAKLREQFGDTVDNDIMDVCMMYMDLLKKADSMYSDRIAEEFNLDSAGKHLEKVRKQFGERPDLDLGTVYGFFVANSPIAHALGHRVQLDNTAACVEKVIADGIPGDLIETGVWQGGQTILMRGILKAYRISDRKVYVADSFQGLPDVDPVAALDDALALSVLDGIGRFRVTSDVVRRNFASYGLLDDQVVFLEGWFSDTLAATNFDVLAIIRLDGDFYESTIDAISVLYPLLSPGGFLIVDDYGCPFGCKRAIDEYRVQHEIDEPMLWVGKQTVYWRKSQVQS